MKTLSLILFSSFMATGLALSQKPGDNAKPLPLQGKDLPDVSAFDAEGKAFPLRQKLKGRHGVIVFGCLT